MKFNIELARFTRDIF